VKKELGRIRRNESEEIRVSLQEVRGELHLELRIYSRSSGHGGAYLPDPETILVPVRVLPDLCHVLEQAHDRLLKEGLVDVPPLATVIDMEAGDPITLGLLHPSEPPPDTCNEPRAPVKLPVQCHLLGAPDSWPSKPLPGQASGQITQVSGGGAEVWFAEQFPVSTRLAVFLQIKELMFRGQAEVVEAAPHPKDGYYRHYLQWLSLSPQARAALSKILEATR
jgi:hypothetical protein